MRHLHARLQHFWRDGKGSAAIEFAFIVPSLVLIYFGIIDIANWYTTNQRLAMAGSAVADLATQNPGQITKGEIIAFWNGLDKIIAPTKVADVKLTMRAFRKSGSSVTPLWPVSSTGGPPCAVDPSAAELTAMGNNEMTDGNDILVAAVCTNVAPLALQMFGYTTLPLRYEISMRPRAGKKLDCTDC